MDFKKIRKALNFLNSCKTMKTVEKRGLETFMKALKKLWNISTRLDAIFKIASTFKNFKKAIKKIQKNGISPK